MLRFFYCIVFLLIGINAQKISTENLAVCGTDTVPCVQDSTDSSSEKYIEPIRPKPNEYTAAVVQYTTDTESDKIDDIPKINAKNYIHIIELAHDLKTDIIVFPEFGLTGLDDPSQQVFEFKETDVHPARDKSILRVQPTRHHISVYKTEMRLKYKRISSIIPSPQENVIPCGDTSHRYAKPLRKISCAAREYKMYVVVNYVEYFIVYPRDNTTKQPDQIYHLYNTNVVFDRNGRVVARQRKHNLSYEPWMNRPFRRNHYESVFTTDFNVTFGQLIGMDIVTISPAQFKQLHPHAQDVILTTRIHEKDYFLSSVQDAATWAYKANRKLLVSGAAWDGACGIYLGNQGPVGGIHIKDKSINMIIYANIPKASRENLKSDDDDEQTQIQMIPLPQTRLLESFIKTLDYSWKIDKIFEFHNQIIPDKTGRSTAKLCLDDNSLCCDFSVSVLFDVTLKETKHYWYHMVIFKKLYRNGHSYSSINSCAIMACTESYKGTCGKRFRPDEKFTSPTSFHEITIQAVAKSEGKLLIPITKENGRIMVASKDYIFTSSDTFDTTYSKKLMDLILKKPNQYLTIFGIIDRIYDTDYVEEIDTFKFSDVLHYIVYLFLLGIFGTLAVVRYQSFFDNVPWMEMPNQENRRGQSAPPNFATDTVNARRNSGARPISNR